MNNLSKIDQAIKELESSLVIEMNMINPNKIKSIALMDLLSSLVTVVKAENEEIRAEIRKRELKYAELAERFNQLEVKYSELIIKDKQN